MEIGDEAIYDLPLVAGIDEDICPAAASLETTIFGSALKSTGGCGADGDDTAAFGLGFVDAVCGLIS